jgi:hypothetical protein
MVKVHWYKIREEIKRKEYKITNLILKKTNKTKVVMVKVDWCKIREEIKRKEYKLLVK